MWGTLFSPVYIQGLNSVGYTLLTPVYIQGLKTGVNECRIYTGVKQHLQFREWYKITLFLTISCQFLALKGCPIEVSTSNSGVSFLGSKVGRSD